MSVGSGLLSPRALAAKKAEIERERARLLASQGLATEDRDAAQRELKSKEEELAAALEQQARLEGKLQDLESKVEWVMAVQTMDCSIQVNSL